MFLVHWKCRTEVAAKHDREEEEDAIRRRPQSWASWCEDLDEYDLPQIR